VGYVHAIAHQLGAKYGTPHGLANAIVMPYVLDRNIDAAGAALAELADAIGISLPDESQRVRAEKFVACVREMNEGVGIPATLETLRREDFTELVKAAADEGRSYAVPRVLARNEIEAILNQMLP